MNYKKIIKNQSFLIGISVFAMAIIIIGTSFAIIQQISNSSQNQVLETGTLNISYTGGTQISGSMLPMSNEDGLSQTGYSFTVENTGSLPMQYDIKIKNADNVNNPLQHQYLKISIDGSLPVLLSSLPKTEETASAVDENDMEYVLLTDQVVAASTEQNHTKQHVVKVWVEEEAPESIIGKTIALNVSIFGIVENSEAPIAVSASSLKIGDKLNYSVTGNQGEISSWIAIKEGDNPETCIRNCFTKYI